MLHKQSKAYRPCPTKSTSTNAGQQTIYIQSECNKIRVEERWINSEWNYEISPENVFKWPRY